MTDRAPEASSQKSTPLWNSSTVTKCSCCGEFVCRNQRSIPRKESIRQALKDLELHTSHYAIRQKTLLRRCVDEESQIRDRMLKAAGAFFEKAHKMKHTDELLVSKVVEVETLFRDEIMLRFVQNLENVWIHFSKKHYEAIMSEKSRKFRVQTILEERSAFEELLGAHQQRKTILSLLEVEKLARQSIDDAEADEYCDLSSAFLQIKSFYAKIPEATSEEIVRRHEIVKEEDKLRQLWGQEFHRRKLHIEQIAVRHREERSTCEWLYFNQRTIIEREAHRFFERCIVDFAAEKSLILERAEYFRKMRKELVQLENQHRKSIAEEEHEAVSTLNRLFSVEMENVWKQLVERAARHKGQRGVLEAVEQEGRALVLDEMHLEHKFIEECILPCSRDLIPLYCQIKKLLFTSSWAAFVCSTHLDLPLQHFAASLSELKLLEQKERELTQQRIIQRANARLSLFEEEAKVREQLMKEWEWHHCNLLHNEQTVRDMLREAAATRVTFIALEFEHRKELVKFECDSFTSIMEEMLLDALHRKEWLKEWADKVCTVSDAYHSQHGEFAKSIYEKYELLLQTEKNDREETLHKLFIKECSAAKMSLATEEHVNRSGLIQSSEKAIQELFEGLAAAIRQEIELLYKRHCAEQEEFLLYEGTLRQKVRISQEKEWKAIRHDATTQQEKVKALEWERRRNEIMTRLAEQPRAEHNHEEDIYVPRILTESHQILMDQCSLSRPDAEDMEDEVAHYIVVLLQRARNFEKDAKSRRDTLQQQCEQLRREIQSVSAMQMEQLETTRKAEEQSILLRERSEARLDAAYGNKKKQEQQITVEENLRAETNRKLQTLRSELEDKKAEKHQSIMRVVRGKSVK